MSVKEKLILERAETAESVGVSSKEVQAYIDHCMELGKELHSVLVIRHGKVACEAYRKPYGPDRKHMMYSVSKSVTSTAVGFAIDEGLFGLETKLIDVFPEAMDEKSNPFLEKLTVKHLLTMRSGIYVPDLMDRSKDTWFSEIISGKWNFEPGTQFKYTNENMYLLCCILHKKTGMSVIDYLTPRLFEPLGIENVFWESDPGGIEAGGWGIMLSPEDLAKYILCYHQKGVFGGRQIIPKWWVEESTKYQSDNSTNLDLDSKAGYGYCFWRNGGCENSYRADGMFCQFGFVFEDYDACLIINGGEIWEQRMRDVIWEHFPKAFTDEPTKEEAVALSIPAYEKLPAKPRSFLEKSLENKTITFSKPKVLNAAGFPVSVLPIAVLFMSSDKAGNITNVSFSFRKDELIFSWTEANEVNSVRVGMDGEYREDKINLGKMPFHTLSVGAWNSENELEIHIRPIEAVAERILVFRFNEKSVSMYPSSSPSSLVMAEWLGNHFNETIKQPAVHNLINAAMPHMASLVDQKHSGKIE